LREKQPNKKNSNSSSNMVSGIVNQAVTALNQGIDALSDYVKANGFAIAVLLGIVWFFKTQCKRW
jgi:type V secretory pathway adhesin AidA